MESTAKGFKRKRTRFNSDVYFHEEERMDLSYPFGFVQSLYDNAMRAEDITNFEFAEYSPGEKLRHLSKEINIRVKIQAHEIFKIGYLLLIAKKICQEQNIRFKLWISLSFHFSYETAVNMMNVYLQCMGHHELAENIPPSILYKISAPSFPSELREFLFRSGILENVTNAEIKELTQKCKKEGIEAIEKDINQLTTKNLTIHQVNYSFDLCENVIRVLADFEEKFRIRGNTGIQICVGESSQKDQDTISVKINSRLFNSIHNALEALRNDVYESKVELNNFLKSTGEQSVNFTSV